MWSGNRMEPALDRPSLPPRVAGRSVLDDEAFDPFDIVDPKRLLDGAVDGAGRLEPVAGSLVHVAVRIAVAALERLVERVPDDLVDTEEVPCQSSGATSKPFVWSRSNRIPESDVPRTWSHSTLDTHPRPLTRLSRSASAGSRPRNHSSST